MKIGVVSEGQAEVRAFKHVLDSLRINGVQFDGPYFADMQPKATPAQIARRAADRLNVAFGRGVDSAIVLIDLEDRPECPPQFAHEIDQGFINLGFQNVSTVVKVRKFENWLIADPQSIARHMRARFNITGAVIDRVVPNRADQINDAEAFLNSLADKKAYHKGKDSIEICRRICPEAMADNSRSFRKFLRLASHPRYVNQSKNP